MTSSPIPTSFAPDAFGQEVLATADGLQMCLVGPAGADQDILEPGSAQASFLDSNELWVVTVDIRPDGQESWNALAQACFEGGATCPSRQVAIVLHGVIQTAPTMQTSEFPSTIQIVGNYSEDEVRAIARIFNDAS